MAKPVYEKLPTETFIVGVDFTGNLPSGATLSTGTGVAYDVFGNVVTSVLLSTGTLTIDSSADVAKVRLAASATQPVGKYLVRFSVVTSQSDTLVEEFFVYVREALS